MNIGEQQHFFCDKSCASLAPKVNAYRFVVYSALGLSLAAVSTVALTLPFLFHCTNSLRQQYKKGHEYCESTALEFISEIESLKMLPFVPTQNRTERQTGYFASKRMSKKECRKCCVPGPPGQPGQNGRPGRPGRPGAPGSPGGQGYAAPLCEVVTPPPCLPCPRGPPGLPGSPGPVGEPGSEGAPGRPGQEGNPGEEGAKGPSGTPGEKGPLGPSGEPGTPATNEQVIPGEPGPSGEQGPVGPSGPTGKVGPPGKDGAPGPKGRNGPEGTPGLNGFAGPPGPQGPFGKNGEKGICPKYVLRHGRRNFFRGRNSKKMMKKDDFRKCDIHICKNSYMCLYVMYFLTNYMYVCRNGNSTPK